VWRVAPLVTAACAAATLAAPVAVHAEFEKSSVYWVSPGTPEIVAAAETSAGYVLAYTNSGAESVGFLGIDTVPGGNQPTELAVLDLAAAFPGEPQAEPTSVAATPDGLWFVVAVNTSVDAPNGGSGIAAVVSAESAAAGTPTIVATFDLPGQPDSVAASKGKSNYVAIVIENETDEDSGNNLGIGTLVSLQTKPRQKPEKWKASTIDLTGLNVTRPDDPEPEYVDINDKDVAAVSLQENNAVVVVDLKSRKIKAAWDAGLASQIADTEEDDIVNFANNIFMSPRTPDAITWTEDGNIALANEGEANLTGGRSVSVHDAMTGAIVDDPEEGLELQHVAHGHYNDGRSGNKGVEFEGVESGVYGGTEYLFGAAERGAGVTVQRGDDYSFVQLLPMIGDSRPEGLLAVPELNLLVAADEELGKVVFYELGTSTYPNIARPTPSDPTTAGSIGWGALSGYSDGPGTQLYAVPDDAYQSSVYSVDVAGYTSGAVALIDGEIPVTDPNGLLPVNNKGQSYLTDGIRALLDLEGIALQLDAGGNRDLANGAWLVAEGDPRADSDPRPNLLVRIDGAGVIQEVVDLPFPKTTVTVIDDDEVTDETREVSANASRFGFEGVTTTGSGAGELVYVAFQRSWATDPDNIARIGVYDPNADAWSFYGYLLDATANNPGLSEIVALDAQNFAVIERDGANGSVDAPDLFKVVKSFSIAGAVPVPNPEGVIAPLDPAARVTPVQRFDLVGTTPGDDLEKWEGLAVKGDTAYAVNDNDGSGETRMVTFDAGILGGS
jgi:hypothetical protein